MSAQGSGAARAPRAAPDAGADRVPIREARVATRRATSAVMTAGVLASAACFAVAVAVEVTSAGGADGSAAITADGSMTDLAALLDGLSAVRPWAWASLGAYVLVATPVIGLVASAAEYARIRDWGTVALALAVLGILALSAVVAVLG